MQHICNGIPAALEDFADDNSLNGEAIVNDAVAWFKNHKQDCYDHFWTGSDDLSGADYCAPEFDVFYVHPDWEPSFSASNALQVSIDNFKIGFDSKLNDSVIFTYHPEDLDPCTGPPDNNGLLPPFSEVEPDTITGFATNVSPIDVSGPSWQGEVISGTVNSSRQSWVGYREDPNANTLTLDGWSLFEDAPANVGTSTVRSEVKRFHIQMLGRNVVNIPQGARYFTAPQKSLLFALGGVVDDQSDYVTARNNADVEFYLRRPGGNGCSSTTSEPCLVNKPFRLSYTDNLGQHWEVDVASTVWAP